MESKVALVLVFNHRFDDNIDKLEKIYEKRFSNIYHLVPFYDGKKKNVIPVYESSYYFQGYLTQGFSKYYNENIVHYLFVADDLILNPAIDEHNYHEHFNITPKDSFIPEANSLHNIDNAILDCYPARLKDGFAKLTNKKVEKWNWCRVYEAYTYNPKMNGVESAKELPAYEDALSLLEMHGVTMKPLTYADVYGGPKKPENFKLVQKNFSYMLQHEVLRKKYHLKYPLAGSYSDIVIVSHECIEKFMHYCGVFAAMELFVELAMPTALMFSTANIVTQKSISKSGVVYWPFSKKRKQQYEQAMQQYEYKVGNLLAKFPAGKLYIHPIKLSKWQMDLN